MSSDKNFIVHPIPPLYDENSRILILGSFPSVKSREAAFFYGHPQNRFWKVISAVMCADTPVTIEEKSDFLQAPQGKVGEGIFAAPGRTGEEDLLIFFFLCQFQSLKIDHIRHILCACIIP